MSFVKHREHDWNVLHARQREVDSVMDRAQAEASLALRRSGNINLERSILRRLRR
jgi:hypothetical protein